MAKQHATGSVYFSAPQDDHMERHTISVVVDNEAGVLARVIGLFSGRGYNIDSLTVSETEHEKHLSRITIVTTGTAMVVEQIKAQLGRLVPVHRVTDLTAEGRPIERELALVKVVGSGNARVEALRLADAFKAQVTDATTGRNRRKNGQDRPIHRFDAGSGPDRSVADWRCRNFSWRNNGLSYCNPDFIGVQVRPLD